MTNETNPQWSRHLRGIADELLHLAVACDLRLRDPGVVERLNPELAARANNIKVGEYVRLP